MTTDDIHEQARLEAIATLKRNLAAAPTCDHPWCTAPHEQMCDCPFSTAQPHKRDGCRYARAADQGDEQ